MENVIITLIIVTGIVLVAKYTFCYLIHQAELRHRAEISKNETKCEDK